MIVKTEAEKIALEKIGKIVAEVRDKMIAQVREGITTKMLDELGGAILDKYCAISAPMHDYDFPGFTCISVNQTAAHGIPDDYMLKKGDMINIDVSAELDGYYADTGKSVVVGQPEDHHEIKEALCLTAYQSLMEGIAAARPGNRIYDIGRAIQKKAKENGFTVIMNLTGHGIGKSLHESPQAISNFFCKSENERIEVGHVLAIETFISDKSNMVREMSDGWGLKTVNDGLVAQYEHTIIVQNGEPIIITT